MISPENKPEAMKTREPDAGPWHNGGATREQGFGAPGKPSALLSVPEGFDSSVVVVTPAMSAPRVQGNVDLCDLPEPEIVPLEYAGKWLAWSPDDLRILAVADTLDEVEAEAQRRGHADVVFEWVPQLGPIPLDEAQRMTPLPPGDSL